MSKGKETDESQTEANGLAKNPRLVELTQTVLDSRRQRGPTRILAAHSDGNHFGTDQHDRIVTEKAIMGLKNEVCRGITDRCREGHDGQRLGLWEILL